MDVMFYDNQDRSHGFSMKNVQIDIIVVLFIKHCMYLTVILVL